MTTKFDRIKFAKALFNFKAIILKHKRTIQIVMISSFPSAGFVSFVNPNTLAPWIGHMNFWYAAGLVMLYSLISGRMTWSERKERIYKNGMVFMFLLLISADVAVLNCLSSNKKDESYCIIKKMSGGKYRSIDCYELQSNTHAKLIVPRASTWGYKIGDTLKYNYYDGLFYQYSGSVARK